MSSESHALASIGRMLYGLRQYEQMRMLVEEKTVRACPGTSHASSSTTYGQGRRLPWCSNNLLGNILPYRYRLLGISLLMTYRPLLAGGHCHDVASKRPGMPIRSTHSTHLNLSHPAFNPRRLPLDFELHLVDISPSLSPLSPLRPVFPTGYKGDKLGERCC